ncbi:MAG TPA: C4-dicarboxylate transporter DctA [Stellaceae bacterium]|nr:C4-dicarboxylate transporter DctA [Stellaceae bacterium]
MSHTMSMRARPKARRPFYRDLSFQVLVGLVVGIAIGYAYPKFGISLKPLGDAFIRMIQMVIGPVIFCTVVHGIAEVGDLKKVGRIAIKALIYYEIVTTLALVIAMVVVNLFQPGAGMNIDPKALNTNAVRDIVGHAQHVETASQFLLLIIPKSIFDAFARGDILQILFFSVVFAGGMAAMGDRAAAPVMSLINVVTQALFWIIRVAMKFAPIAACGAMAYTVGQFGFGTLISLFELVGVLWLVCALFILLILWPITIWAGFSLWKLIRYIGEELLLVIGTSSQETVFPQLTQKLRRLGCNETIVGLVLPTSYTFNHDGTCIYVACVAVFLAEATNTPLDLTHQIGLLAVLLLTTKGAAGVSGAALVVLAATLAAYGTVPVAAVALVVGIHRFLSPAFVSTNVMGNTIATLMMAHWENGLDRKKLKEELDAGYIPDSEARTV